MCNREFSLKRVYIMYHDCVTMFDFSLWQPSNPRLFLFLLHKKLVFFALPRSSANFGHDRIEVYLFLYRSFKHRIYCFFKCWMPAECHPGDSQTGIISGWVAKVIAITYPTITRSPCRKKFKRTIRCIEIPTRNIHRTSFIFLPPV